MKRSIQTELCDMRPYFYTKTGLLREMICLVKSFCDVACMIKMKEVQKVEPFK